MTSALSRRLREGRHAGVPPFTRAQPAPGPDTAWRTRHLMHEFDASGSRPGDPLLEALRRLLMLLVYDMVRTSTCALFSPMLVTGGHAEAATSPPVWARLDYERVRPHAPRLWIVRPTHSIPLEFGALAHVLATGRPFLVFGSNFCGAGEWLNNAWRLRAELEAEEAEVGRVTRLPAELSALVVDYLCVTPERLWRALEAARPTLTPTAPDEAPRPAPVGAGVPLMHVAIDMDD